MERPSSHTDVGWSAKAARRRLLWMLAALTVVGTAVAVAVAAWRGPLGGATRHDFGRVEISMGGRAELKHTFRLTNRTDRAISLLAARPDCGCVTIASPSSQKIEPGAILELPITMQFSSPKKTVLISLDLGDAGMQTLRVSATARFRSRLSSTAKSVSVTAGAPTIEKFMAEIFESGDMPAPPTIMVARGFRATFEGWTLLWRPKDLRIAPCQWQGAIRIERVDEAPDSAGLLTIEITGIQPLSFNLHSLGG